MRKPIPKVLCSKCGGEIQKSNYDKHFNSCNGIKKERFKKLQECPYCHKDLSQIEGGNHVRWCDLNPKSKEYRTYQNGRTAWNKSKTKSNNEIVKQCSESLKQGYKEGRLKCRLKHEKGKHLSETHKLKIQKAQKELVLKGLHHGWKLVNGNVNRRSYPEIWFIKNVIKKYNLHSKYSIKEKYNFGKYFFDFAFVDLKLDVEIDGGQHISSQKAIEHDILRDNYTKSLGWNVYRINWKDLQRNPNEEIKKFLQLVP